ncbi:uncharacterized, partial [Tachysurus ichikawai]
MRKRRQDLAQLKKHPTSGSRNDVHNHQGLMEIWSNDSGNCCHNWRNTRNGDTTVYHCSALLLPTP